MVPLGKIITKSCHSYATDSRTVETHRRSTRRRRTASKVGPACWPYWHWERWYAGNTIMLAILVGDRYAGIRRGTIAYCGLERWYHGICTRRTSIKYVPYKLTGSHPALAKSHSSYNRTKNPSTNYAVQLITAQLQFSLFSRAAACTSLISWPSPPEWHVCTIAFPVLIGLLRSPTKRRQTPVALRTTFIPHAQPSSKAHYEVAQPYKSAKSMIRNPPNYG